MKSKAALAACVISLASTVAQAADPATIERPEVKVGQRWHTIVKDGIAKTRISDTTYTVASVSEKEVVLNDATGRQAMVLDAAHYGLKSIPRRIYKPLLQHLKFPLVVGNRWESAYRFDDSKCGEMDVKLNFQVGGWEDVTTPAGKVRALRIDSNGHWRCGQSAGEMASAHWMVAELPVPLQQETLVFAMNRVQSYEVLEVQSFTKP